MAESKPTRLLLMLVLVPTILMGLLYLVSLTKQPRAIPDAARRAQVPKPKTAKDALGLPNVLLPKSKKQFKRSSSQQAVPLPDASIPINVLPSKKRKGLRFSNLAVKQVHSSPPYLTGTITNTGSRPRHELKLKAHFNGSQIEKTLISPEDAALRPGQETSFVIQLDVKPSALSLAVQ